MGNSHKNLLTQGSFQQSLVEISSVVSEKIFFLISSPLFSIFSFVAILVGSRDHQTRKLEKRGMKLKKKILL
jgi:hypothetical protein